MLRVLISILLFVPSHAFAEPEVKGSPDELKRFLHAVENVVVLTGKAEETAYSDKAIIDLIIKVEEEALANAIKKNASLRAMINERLIKAGVQRDNIKTSKFSTSPQFGWFGKKPDTYEVINRMSLSVFTEAHLTEVAAIADEHEAIQFSGTRFEHTEKEVFEKKVLESALQNVKSKKIFYEKSLGVRLSPIEFSESSHRPEPTAGAAALEEVVVLGTAIRSRGRIAKYSEDPKPVAPTFDELVYKQQITVRYVVEPVNKSLK